MIDDEPIPLLAMPKHDIVARPRKDDSATHVAGVATPETLAAPSISAVAIMKAVFRQFQVLVSTTTS